MASIAIILGGSIYYTWVKHVESNPASSASRTGSRSSSREKVVYERVPMDDLEAGKDVASDEEVEAKRKSLSD